MCSKLSTPTLDLRILSFAASVSLESNEGGRTRYQGRKIGRSASDS